jgi:hypothetical protein
MSRRAAEDAEKRNVNHEDTKNTKEEVEGLKT